MIMESNTGAMLSKKDQKKAAQKNRVPHKLKELNHLTKTAYHKGRLKPMGRKNKDHFQGPPLHSEQSLARYDWGDRLQMAQVRDPAERVRLLRHERAVTGAVHQMVTSEKLLSQESGFLETEPGEDSADVGQTELSAAVDITSAAKRFDLQLRQYGPYSLSYTRNGRHLALGGSTGHLAAFDAVTKRLLCEIGTPESIHDVQWLHNENMFAAAQKEWVHVYDSTGLQLHCVKKLSRVLRMEFLPYHFLLATCSERGWLSWLDVSTGALVQQINARMGRLDVLCQNPSNAVLCLGHTRGVVSMWTPSVPEPVARILCHGQPVRGVAVEQAGTYMATACIDRSVKVWDLRTYKCLQNFAVGGGASRVQWSQSRLLAASIGNMVEIYKNVHVECPQRAYLRHRCTGLVSALQFCPYEDVLGIGHRDGFSSVLVPGAGEANFDAYESNPFETKKQRRETEVKQLLEKIQPELITLNPGLLGQVDVPTLQEKFAAKQKLLYVKTPKIDFTPRKKTKGRGKASKVILRKKNVQFQEKKVYLKEAKSAAKKYLESTKAEKTDTVKRKQKRVDGGEQSTQQQSVLDRFHTKPIKKV